MKRLTRVGLLTLSVMAMNAMTAFAFQAQEGFVPADQLHKEQVPGGALMIAAYAIVWVVVVAYVLTLWRRAGRIERDLADLSSKVTAARR